MIETVNGIAFDMGEKALSECGKFWVCPVEFEFAGRKVSYVMDAAYLDLPDARRHHFTKLAAFIEQAKEFNA